MIKLNNGRIILLNGDCLHEMRRIKPNSIDAVIADIPSGRTKCTWDHVIPFETMWKHLRRITKPHAALVLLGCTQPFTSMLIMSNLTMFKYTWVWEKHPCGHLSANHRPLLSVEDICIFSLASIAPSKRIHMHMIYNPQGVIPIHKIQSNAGRNWGATIHAHMGANNQLVSGGEYTQKLTNYPRQILRYENETGLHPTQKPLLLLEYLIKTYTNPGDTVLDPTMGSGTTGVACANLNRRFIGIEKDENYFNIAAQRIEQSLTKPVNVSTDH